MVKGGRGGGEPAVEPAVIKTRPAPSVPNDGASLTLITGLSRSTGHGIREKAQIGLILKRLSSSPQGQRAGGLRGSSTYHIV